MFSYIHNLLHKFIRLLINNLKDGDNDVPFAVISQYDGDVIVLTP